MSNSKESTKFVYAELADEDFRMLNRWATSIGKRTSNVVSDAVREYLKTRAINEKGTQTDGTVPLDLILLHRHYLMSRDQDHKARLMEMAFTYQEYPTEDNADMLALSCEDCGFTKEEVLEWINDDQLVPFSGDTGTVTGKAMTWLQRHMELGEEYRCTDISEESGFSDSALRSAKTKLGIRSVRRSAGWVWVRGEKEEETPILEHPAYLAD